MAFKLFSNLDPRTRVQGDQPSKWSGSVVRPLTNDQLPGHSGFVSLGDAGNAVKLHAPNTVPAQPNVNMIDNMTDNKTETTNGIATSTDLVERYAKQKAAEPRLIRLTAEMTIKDSPHGYPNTNEDSFMEDPNRWISWDFATTPLPVENTVLLCRKHFGRGVIHNTVDRCWIGTLELLCSVHPIGGQITDYDARRGQWSEDLHWVLQPRFKGKHGGGLPYLFRTEIVKIEVDPGIPKPSTKQGWNDSRGKGKIMSGLNLNTDVQTCYLSGQHFYPSIPLAFFFESDVDKPVAPGVAWEVGFHVYWEDWFNICKVFAYKENVEEFRRRKDSGRPFDDENARAARCMGWGGWPGDIEDYFGQCRYMKLPLLIREFQKD